VGEQIILVLLQKQNLVGVKVLDSSGSGSFDTVIAGIEWNFRIKISIY